VKPADPEHLTACIAAHDVGSARARALPSG